MSPASWVICHRQTGKSVFETYERKTAEIFMNRNLSDREFRFSGKMVGLIGDYEAVPIDIYLPRLNAHDATEEQS